jgi:hypothetical protein
MPLRDNAAQHRFEIDVDGHVAFVTYKLAPGGITLVHTEVPAALSGRGVGSMLVRSVLEEMRSRGAKITVRCPFIRGFMEKHPEFADLLH